jgi:hypothetical protein
MAERVSSRGTGPGRSAMGGLAMNRLQRLREAGVSIWLDTLSRDLLESGAFATLVDEQLLSCVESQLGSRWATP